MDVVDLPPYPLPPVHLQAYDIAAVKCRGMEAQTNYCLSNYNDELEHRDEVGGQQCSRRRKSPTAAHTFCAVNVLQCVPVFQFSHCSLDYRYVHSGDIFREPWLMMRGPW